MMIERIAPLVLTQIRSIFSYIDYNLLTSFLNENIDQILWLSGLSMTSLIAFIRNSYNEQSHSFTATSSQYEPQADGGNDGGSGDSSGSDGDDDETEIKKILEGANPERQKGRPKIYGKKGGEIQAKKDFARLSGREQPKENGVLVKRMNNGQTATLRSSTDRRLTIDIQKSNTKRGIISIFKIRYSD
ncbi:unnamed protein product [Didymodactylos carnosus]|uniref:Uncharacterized protein n=2 Tax=Didymodactylos carnosus TaxID=1234261 RepID=A0A816C9U2_9BILA|nr:unnamed protein product [Didymodactylos carnosus]CAF4512442.1 unnamed protein product [Didymodactylos carnosus]